MHELDFNKRDQKIFEKFLKFIRPKNSKKPLPKCNTSLNEGKIKLTQVTWTKNDN